MATELRQVAAHYATADLAERLLAAATAAGGPHQTGWGERRVLPPLGPHLLVSGDFPRMVANVVGGLRRGVIAPVELIAPLRR